MDEDIREARRAALENLDDLAAYLTALGRAGRLLVHAGEQAPVILQVKLTLDQKKLRTHPWPTMHGRKRGAGTWWAPGAGQHQRRLRLGDPGRVYLLPATDRGHVWWQEDHAVGFDGAADLTEWLAGRAHAWREPKSTTARTTGRNKESA